MNDDRLDPRAGKIVIPSENASARRAKIPGVAIPEAVRKAAENHERVLDAERKARTDLNALRRDAERARAQDIVDDATRIVAGKPPLNPSERSAPKLDDKILEAKRSVLAHVKAGHASELELTQAVRAAVDEWVAAVEAEHAQALEHYRGILDELAKASAALAQTEGARRWLHEIADDKYRRLPLGSPNGVVRVTVANLTTTLSEVVAALRTAGQPERPPYTSPVPRERKFAA